MSKILKRLLIFAIIGLAIYIYPQVYWKGVKSANIEILDLEIKIDQLGYDRFNDFDMVITYDLDGAWEGTMLGDEDDTGGWGYYKHFKGATPYEVAEKMETELLTIKPLKQ